MKLKNAKDFWSGVMFIAFGLFFASVLLYSQAATTRALMPLGIALGIPPQFLIAMFPSVNASGSAVRQRMPGADPSANVITEGANLAVIETRSAGELLFRERFEGLWLASPIQIYLDLIRGEGRSKEMAEHFRKERIGF